MRTQDERLERSSPRATRMSHCTEAQAAKFRAYSHSSGSAYELQSRVRAGGSKADARASAGVRHGGSAMTKPWMALVGPEIEENLSLRYLASSLRRAGFDSRILAFNHEGQLIEVVDAI